MRQLRVVWLEGGKGILVLKTRGFAGQVCSISGRMVRRNSQKDTSGVALLGRFDQYHDAIVSSSVSDVLTRDTGVGVNLEDAPAHDSNLAVREVDHHDIGFFNFFDFSGSTGSLVTDAMTSESFQRSIACLSCGHCEREHKKAAA